MLPPGECSGKIPESLLIHTNVNKIKNRDNQNSTLSAVAWMTDVIKDV